MVKVNLNGMKYHINDVPSLKETLTYALQQLFSVIVATVLISSIVGTPTTSCLVGACLGTLVYQLITKGQSPMFISSSGALAGACISALAAGGYSAVVAGGFTIMLIYGLIALVVKKFGVEVLEKYLPSTIVGAITIVIGVNLAKFIPTYIGEGSINMIIALVTMFTIAIVSHYGKGFVKTIPFLAGIVVSYVLCIILTLCGTKVIDFSIFKGVKLLMMPDFTFKYMTTIDWPTIIKSAIIFIPVTLAACCEHISDHKVLSNIIGVDLLKTPGLSRTLLGDGVASFVGTIFCGLPNTSYGESIATTGFSKVASTRVITVAALLLGSLGFLGPVQAFILSVPSAITGGCAIILYGYILCSGISTLISHNVDLSVNKNIIIVSSIITIGTCGIFFLNEALSDVALAMIVGIILNLILKDR